MRRAELEAWIGRYERAWRTPGTDALRDLFAPDATYRASPWSEPVRGLPAIATLWDAERDSADEPFAMTSSVVACDGDVGVARVEVHYGHGSSWRDLWIVRFDADARCVEFEEWPFAPEQDDGHTPS